MFFLVFFLWTFLNNLIELVEASLFSVVKTPRYLIKVPLSTKTFFYVFNWFLTLLKALSVSATFTSSIQCT